MLLHCWVWKWVHWNDKTGEQTCISVFGRMQTVQGDKQAVDTPQGALCPPLTTHHDHNGINSYSISLNV